ncbi:TetR/AcrR family transcriptional regulator [Paraburkholderia fungorum]|uniref:TetR/AcrR family transcriptional regulator n=1 Tax=Paraburkholderia fungorum TaxID=134537 RepID=UPI0038BBC555
MPPDTKTRKSIARPGRDRPYHHRSLPQALLEAAETVLRRDGIGSMTLRAIAREAGVSHTAPQHHFGDTAGVLGELAASGHRRLAASVAAKAEGIPAGLASRKAIARGYASFAVDNPDLFRLMFRSELLDHTRASLVDARQLSARALMGVFDDPPECALGETVTFDRLDVAQAIAMTVAWAFVHGLASLLIDGRLKALATSTEGISNTAELLDATIEHAQLVDDAGCKPE